MLCMFVHNAVYALCVHALYGYVQCTECSVCLCTRQCTHGMVEYTPYNVVYVMYDCVQCSVVWYVLLCTK